MSELKELHKIYSYMYEEMDTHTEEFLEDLPNEGQTIKFLEEIRNRPLKIQTFFIRALVKFRPECEARLIELASEPDENVQVLANAGLLHTNQNPVALSFFREKIIQRLLNDKLNDGEWPIHFLMDYLMEPGVKGGKEVAEEILIEAKLIKDVNQEQIVWIKKYL